MYMLLGLVALTVIVLLYLYPNFPPTLAEGFTVSAPPGPIASKINSAPTELHGASPPSDPTNTGTAPSTTQTAPTTNQRAPTTNQINPSDLHNPHFTSSEGDQSSPSDRGGINLIGNGSFSNGKDITGHAGSNIGNKIIVHPNPGKSSYVLRQSVTSDENKGAVKMGRTHYLVNTKLKTGHYYKLSSWVYDSIESESPDHLYTFGFHMKNQTSSHYSTPASEVETSTVDHNVWKRMDVVFQVPSDSSGSVDIILDFMPKNVKDHRYITDVWLEYYHPLLNSFPYNHQLAFFLSVFHPSSYDKRNGRMWKDMSNHGKDFLFTQDPDYGSKGVTLNQDSVIGPPCSELGLDATKFTLGWNLKCNNLTGTKVFAKLFTSAEQGATLNITYVSSHAVYHQVHISYLGKNMAWDIGMTNSISVFNFVYDKGTMTLYKDGAKMRVAGKTGKVPDGANISGENGILESFVANPHHGGTYFINKPFLLNPNKNFAGILYNAFAFHTAIHQEQATAIYHYFSFLSGRHVAHDTYTKMMNVYCQIPVQTPVTINEKDVFRQRQDSINNSFEQRLAWEEKCRRLISEKADQPPPHPRPAQPPAPCPATAPPIPPENPAIASLIKAFNDKEKSQGDPCKKVSYHIKPDGKVVKTIKRLRNCNSGCDK